MENILYNILWIDDEHETLTGFIPHAKTNGINLVPFKSLNKGISELKNNLHFYDGVLLDAKFFENEDDEEGTEDTYYVHRAKEEILQLKKKFEIFVLTGQAEAYEDSTFKKSFPRTYEKGDELIEKLFKDIKKAADGQEDTQIRHSHQRVFDVCTDKYIGKHAGQDILNLLKINDETNINNHFNAVRKVVEDLFRAFNKFNLLPDEFVTPHVALNESSKFLAGKGDDGSIFKEKGYQHLEGTHLHKQIAYYLRSILYVANEGSHRSEIDSYITDIKTPYLLKSVLFQLLDVLVWFKKHVDSKPKTNNWVKLETATEVTEPAPELIPGKVIKIIPQKRCAFFKPDTTDDNIFIPMHLVTNHSLTEGMTVQAEVEEYTYNPTNELKSRVKRIVLPQ